MRQYLEQQVVRAATALCFLAAQSPDAGVRDDMRDEAAALIRLWATVADPSHVRRWCQRVGDALESLADSSTHQAVRSAQAAVLRLYAELAEPVQKPPAVHPIVHSVSVDSPSVGGFREKILAFVGEHPGVRTRELILHFSTSMSDRTIKRWLKELVVGGALDRVETDGMVSYRLTD